MLTTCGLCIRYPKDSVSFPFFMHVQLLLVPWKVEQRLSNFELQNISTHRPDKYAEPSSIVAVPENRNVQTRGGWLVCGVPQLALSWCWSRGSRLAEGDVGRQGHFRSTALLCGIGEEGPKQRNRGVCTPGMELAPCLVGAAACAVAPRPSQGCDRTASRRG